MNLNKYTKAELKQKILDYKNESNKNSSINKINSYFSQVWYLFKVFKDILLKLTFISFILKILRKYSLFNRLWRILNTIVMSIFGISLLDNFGIEFISNFFKEIKFIFSNTIDYLTNTHFYMYLTKLFSTKEIIENKVIEKQTSKQQRIHQENSRNEENITKGETNSKISEWLNQKEEIKSEIKDESSYKYYYILASLLLASCLTWYYWNDIRTGGTSLMEWIKSFFPGDDPNNNSREELNRQARARINISEKYGLHEKFKSAISRDDNNIESSSKVKLEDLKGKLTSASLDDLVNRSQDSWLEGSTSSSTSSDETIKPLSENQLRDISSIKEELKIYLPEEIIEEMNYVESRLPLSNLEDASELGSKMADIKTSNVQFKNLIESQRKDGKPELLIEVAEENYKNLEKWIEKTIKEIEK